MTPEELLSRIRHGEDERTELKEAPAPGKVDGSAIAKALAALANSGGGDLFVGVDDEGAIVGVGTRKDADAVQRAVRQVADANVMPPAPRKLSIVEWEGRFVVVAHVPGFDPGRPFRANGKYYVRSGADSREATPDELVSLVQSAARTSWDESAVPAATKSDLDPEAMRSFFRVAYADVNERDWPAYLTALKATTEDGEITPTGLLVMGRDPQRFFVDANVTCLRLPGTELSTDLVDKAHLDGTLQAQLDGAFAFVTRHVSRASHVEGALRKETGVPDAVFREALSNALIHRDYRAASQTRVFVFDDRVEVRNPGSLLNRLTIDGIRLGGVTQRRNPHLAAALVRLGRRENAGLGVPDMFRRMRERGLPEPEIRLDGGDFCLVLRTTGSEAPG